MMIVASTKSNKDHQLIDNITMMMTTTATNVQLIVMMKVPVSIFFKLCLGNVLVKGAHGSNAFIKSKKRHKFEFTGF